MKPTKLLTVREVADMFSVAVSSVWRWVKEGVLPEPIKIGSRTRWLEDELLIVIDQRRAVRKKPSSAKKRLRVRLNEGGVR
ncbi:helix-turn-helix domain-containing protein [Nitratireductor sp. GISD-1A_MAKvit]|uniref:helix-turn-helix transcriptional regulator n=1 Tax=Nitratireductor sp. GISD-1A_MAKvit TaxID=3234198 RepID=UPI0034663017